jgi:predicted DNA-binding protein
MNSPKYKGKRVAVTFPQATYERVHTVAEELTRTDSATVVYLVEIALKTLETKEN